MSDPAHKPAQVVLSRDLSEFLVELSIALHRHSMYPSGHPSLGPTVAGVIRRAERLLQDRASIAFGVARRQLVIEGVTTDPDQPVLRRLAEGLHRHHIGAISISRGVEAYEISEALHALASEPERDGALGLEDGERPTDWPHVHLYPLTFDHLTLVGDVPLSEDGEGGTRSAQLWVGLARAAIATGDEGAEIPTEASVVARAIDDHPRAAAYDQVIIGYLLQIARELKTSGAEADQLRRRTSTLIAVLRPETLRRLVEMGGDSGQRGAFVLDAAHGMAVDAVVEIVKAAAEANGQTISHGLVRMLSKLASHADHGTALSKPLADTALREQVSSLLSDWYLQDPNPDAHGHMLQRLATSTADAAPNDASRVAQPPDPLRVVQIALETGTLGPMLDKAVNDIVEDGKLGSLLELLNSRPEGGDAVADAVLTKLLQPATLSSLISRERIDLASLDGLLPFLSADGYDTLLDALAASESRTTRRRLLDRLACAALDIGMSIMARLEDERWYVQRNMLVLLERSGRLPQGFSPTRWTTHADARVRYEAVRLQLTMPHEREIGIRTALEDPDPRVVRLGLGAVQHDCPPTFADRVARHAVATESDDELRLLAVTALAHLPQVQGLHALLRVADGGKTLLGRLRLPSKTPVLLVALRALADTWRHDSKAAAVLAAAAVSSDPDIRRAAHLDHS